MSRRARPRRADPPLAGFRPAPPPPGLRERVLTAATAAATRPKARPQRRRSAVDRLWESRPLRLAWLAAIGLLLAANLALEAGAPPGAGAAQLLAARSTGLAGLAGLVGWADPADAEGPAITGREGSRS